MFASENLWNLYIWWEGTNQDWAKGEIGLWCSPNKAPANAWGGYKLLQFMVRRLDLCTPFTSHLMTVNPRKGCDLGQIDLYNRVVPRED